METLALLVLIMLAAAMRGKVPAGVTPAAALPPTVVPAPSIKNPAAAVPAAAQAKQAAAQVKNASMAPRPWPQAVPKGLPPWPSGWQPDTPPPPEVVARAWQLLQGLWAKGAGSIKTEMTGGRWITYMAATTAGNTKGVVAYRIKPGAPRANA